MKSLFFKELPLTFQPEEGSYYIDIGKFSLLFAIVSLGLLSIFGIYIYVIFKRNKDYKYLPENRIDYAYKVITWILYSISVLSGLILLIFILIYLGKSHVGLIKNFPEGIQTEINNEKSYLSELISLNSFLQANNLQVNTKIIDLASNIKEEISQNESNLNQYKSMVIKELIANITFISLLLCSYAVIAIAYKKRSLKIIKGSLFFSICLLFLLPITQIFNFEIWFYNIDLCDNNNQAIYFNKLPAYNKGLGFFLNCHSGEIREKINNLNTELEEVYSNNNNPKQYEPILMYKATSLDLLLTCDSMYNSIILTEYELCAKSVINYDTMNILVLLLAFPIILLFWVNKRLFSILNYYSHEEQKYEVANS